MDLCDLSSLPPPLSCDIDGVISSAKICVPSVFHYLLYIRGKGTWNVRPSVVKVKKQSEILPTPCIHIHILKKCIAPYLELTVVFQGKD